jgi:hypothetical protein
MDVGVQLQNRVDKFTAGGNVAGSIWSMGWTTKKSEFETRQGQESFALSITFRGPPASYTMGTGGVFPQG